MTKAVNNTASAINLDNGRVIPASGELDIDLVNFPAFANDDVLWTKVAAGDVTINDGSDDLDTAGAMDHLKGFYQKLSTDTDGAPISRTKAAKKGWTYHMHAIQFESCKLNSLVEKDETDTATSYGTIKFYDSSDVEQTTQANIDANAVKTVIDFEPDFDYEIIGGKVQNLTVPSNSLRLFVVAVPDITYANGGSRVMINNIDISYLNAKSEVNADGRASKYMTYNATYHTNKLRVIMYHLAGEKVKFQMIYEMYRA